MLYHIQQNEDQMFLRKAKEYAELRILDRPKMRLDAMIDLRAEIYGLCQEFYDNCKNVVDRILSETHDPDKDEGLLEIDPKKYMACFNVNLDMMDKLLCEEIQNKTAEL